MKITSINPSAEKIGNLTNAGSDINLAPSVLTIGGLQYHTEATLIASLPALTANNRYQVFAVLNAGAVELAVSQNENSQGPAGFNAWKLVGSFMANGESSVAFGAFLNIKGDISTEWISDGVTEMQLTGGNTVTKGTIVVDQSWYRIEGKIVHQRFEYSQSAVGAVSGNGDYLFAFPKNLPANMSKYTPWTIVENRGNYNIRSNIGEAQVANVHSNSILEGCCVVYDSLNYRVAGIYNRSTDTNSQGFMTDHGGTEWFSLRSSSQLNYYFNASYESTALPSKPIEDL